MFGDVEVDIVNIEMMERDGVGVVVGGIWVVDLLVFFSFGELYDDGNI